MKNLNFCKTFILVLLSIVLLSIVFLEKILLSYGSFFMINTAKKGADGIVVLAGNDITRVKKAIELKKEGYSKKIYITSAKEYSKNYLSVYKSRANEIAEIFSVEKEQYEYIKSYKDGATSTFDEAYDVANFVKINSLKGVIIVTDEFHTKRALYAFKKIFKKQNIDIKIEVAGAKNSIFNAHNWYKTEDGLSSLISEGMKYILYHFIDRNLESVKEG